MYVHCQDHFSSVGRSQHSDLQPIRPRHRRNIRSLRPAPHYTNVPNSQTHGHGMYPYNCAPSPLRSLNQILDHLLGPHDESTTYRKAELKTFVSLGVEDMLGEDEVALLGSVLEFSGKRVADVMVRALAMWLIARCSQSVLMCQTPLEDVFSLSAERIVVSCRLRISLIEQDDELVSEVCLAP